jgi:uncharacterized protein YcgL (UPF0745 family)
MNCAVYRCRRKADTYLFAETKTDPDALPEDLRDLTGPLERVMTLELHPGRHLANANAKTVMRKIQQCGYYLQLPPTDNLFSSRG